MEECSSSRCSVAARNASLLMLGGCWCASSNNVHCAASLIATSLSTAPLADEAREFFASGQPEIADKYFPWLVNLMSPAYWIYLAMGATVISLEP